MRKIMGLALVAALLAGGAYFLWRRTSSPKGAAPPPARVAVTAAEVKQQDFPDDILSFGQLATLDSVVVQAQVTALLKESLVRDGQRVKKDDLLFRLDDREFVAAVRQAQASLEAADAQARYDKLQFDRYEDLFRTGAVTQEQRDTYESTYQTAVANRAVAAAALDEARLKLGYCEIRAPFAGCLGKIQITDGNLLTENVSTLVTLNRLDPLRISFFAPETRLADVRAALERPGDLVTVTPDDGGGKTAAGRLVFMDNAVDTATGVIRLEGEIANADAALWPGQYVRVRLRLKSDPNALVVPEAALHADPAGDYSAAVIRPDQTVEFRTLKLVRQSGDLAMVAGNLKAGERVVLDGFLQLTPGAAVDVKP